jgi:hypothetical protein
MIDHAASAVRCSDTVVNETLVSAPAIRHSRAADRASGSSGSLSLVPSKMPAT